MRDVSPDFADLVAPAVRYVCALMPQGYEWPADVVEESLTDEGNAWVVETVIREFLDSPHLIKAAGEYMKASEMTAMPPFAVVREMLEGMTKPQRFNAITPGRFLKRFRDNPCAPGTFRVVPRSAARTTAGWRIDFTDEFMGLAAQREAENEAARNPALYADPLPGIWLHKGVGAIPGISLQKNPRKPLQARVWRIPGIGRNESRKETGIPGRGKKTG